MRFIATVDGYAGDKEYDSIEEFAKTLANFINSASEGEKINFAVFNISNEKIEKNRLKKEKSYLEPELELEPKLEPELNIKDGIDDKLTTAKGKINFNIGKELITKVLKKDDKLKAFEIREKTGMLKTSLRRYLVKMIEDEDIIEVAGEYSLKVDSSTVSSDKMTYEKGKNMIISVLNDDDGEWLVVSDIRKKTGLASRTSTTYLKKMREDGSVRYDGSGFFKYKRK